jgi:hypothetical protein
VCLPDGLAQGAGSWAGDRSSPAQFFPQSQLDRDKPKFYPLPQPKLPDKPYEKAPTQTYQGPEQGA